jgi:uroporphyrinogen-III synthase
MNVVLQGFTVGITADRRWEEQAALFERRGGTILHAPTIRTLPLGSDTRLQAATVAVISRPPDVVIANTGLGIRSWFGAAESWGQGAEFLHALRAARIFARGPKASGAVHSLGLPVAARGGSERLSEAVDLALPHLAPGRVVALQVDGSGGTPEADRLRSSGADVIEVPVYQWKLPEDRQPAVRLAEAVIAGRVHAVTFTTGPAIRNWMAITAEHELDEALRSALTSGRVIVGCVGPVCADVAINAGLASEHLVVPAAWRLGPLVRVVADRLVGRRLEVSLADADVVLTGTVVRVNGEPFTLTDVEARLLATLAARPNVVFAKTDLLTEVWGGRTADPHVVEVAVARLRRRLGTHGSAVESVHRRGYMLRARA